MTTKFNRIIFDYDGTLIIHDGKSEGRAIAKILNIPEEQMPYFIKRLNYFFKTSYGRRFYIGQKMTFELYYTIMNKIMQPNMFGITAKQLDEAINFESKYASKIEPTAKDTLEYLLDKGYELCILTNGFEELQIANMKCHELYGYFHEIYAWDNYFAKPDPRALERALVGMPPEHNIMVGDSLINDIMPAKAMGIYTVGINISDYLTSYNKPDKLITSLSELKMFL